MGGEKAARKQEEGALLRPRPYSGLCSSDDSGNCGEVVRDADVDPRGRVEKWLDGGETLVAEFEDQDAAGLEMGGRLGNELAVKLVALFAPVECNLGLMIANFAQESCGFAPADVGRIADDQIEGQVLNPD